MGKLGIPITYLTPFHLEYIEFRKENSAEELRIGETRFRYQ